MDTEYKLMATPSLIADGEFKGELKGIWFRAASLSNAQEWFVVNCGQFERAFGKLVPPRLAEAMVAMLTAGQPVDFPQLYHEEQFEGGFHYGWCPVHFAPPELDASHQSEALHFEEWMLVK